MATITKAEASALRSLQNEAGWNIVMKLLGARIDELGARANGITGSSAFEELQALHKCQGGVAELKQFFEDMEHGAFE